MIVIWRDVDITTISRGTANKGLPSFMISIDHCLRLNEIDYKFVFKIVVYRSYDEVVYRISFSKKFPNPLHLPFNDQAVDQRHALYQNPF